MGTEQLEGLAWCFRRRVRYQHQQTLITNEKCLSSLILSLSRFCFSVRRYVRIVTMVYRTLSVESRELTWDYQRALFATDEKPLINDRGMFTDLSSIDYFMRRLHSLAHRMYTLLTSIYSARLSSKLSLPSPLLFQPPKGKSQHPVGLVQFTPIMPLSSFVLTRRARSRSLVYRL
jgi:hypothetical protein